MVQALLQITQAANVGANGQALKGDSGAAVVFSNADNTGVVSWAYELLYVPPGSSLVVHSQGPNTTPTFNIGTPTAGKAGCYRVRLTVADSSGNQDVDIRNFGLPTANNGWIIPPDQRLPPPLPLIGAGSKPDEMNFGGQAFGWQGDDNTARKLLYGILTDLDSGIAEAGRFLRRTLLRAGTGTHVCLPTATKARLRGGGGGGAGGGALGSAGNPSVGSCSSAAGVFDVLIALTAGLSIPYIVGAGGTPVVGAAGGDGHDTTATYNSIVYAGRKGRGGPFGASGSTLQVQGVVDGGIAENGDANYKGGVGGLAVRESGTSGMAGNGGNSAEAPGGFGTSSSIGASVSNDGGDGQFSSGGGGAIDFSGVGRKGGAGGEGFLWVYEYS